MGGLGKLAAMYLSIIHERLITCDHLEIVNILLIMVIITTMGNNDLVLIVLLFEPHGSHASIDFCSKMLDTLLQHPSVTLIPLL